MCVYKPHRMHEEQKALHNVNISNDILCFYVTISTNGWGNENMFICKVSFRYKFITQPKFTLCERNNSVYIYIRIHMHVDAAVCI